jgi:hypothetical protein
MLLIGTRKQRSKATNYLYMSIEACPVEGCVLLQVGGINILHFSYAITNRTYESSSGEKKNFKWFRLC